MFISGFASGLSCFAGSTFFSGIMNNSIMFACIDQGCLFVIIRRVCRQLFYDVYFDKISILLCVVTHLF